MKEVKGWGPWKYRWFSICSMHGLGINKYCKACNTGHWTNVWKWKIGSFIFKIAPRLWRWWMNLVSIKKRAFTFEKFDNH